MPRWSPLEIANIEIVRKHCAHLIASCPAYPEVVGDRKIVRFLRGHNHDVEKVSLMMEKFLKWRVDNSVDEIRANIVERGCDHPLRFPKGELILKLIPQLVILPYATDKLGCPICVEQYNFVPAEVFQQITMEDYILFVIYTLEYKSLIIEQLSELRERKYLNSLSDDERAEIDSISSTKPPYGVLANICVIRDLFGVGFAHLGAQGQEIIHTVVSLATDNYPELMRKCFMINTPYVFYAVWYVVKGWLAARTIAKVSVSGSGFMSELLQDIDSQFLPAMVGGEYKGFVDYEAFAFDLGYLMADDAVVTGYLMVDDAVPCVTLDSLR